MESRLFFAGESFFHQYVEGRLKFRLEKKGMKRYFDGTWKFGTAKLVHTFNKWFLRIPIRRITLR